MVGRNQIASLMLNILKLPIDLLPLSGLHEKTDDEMADLGIIEKKERNERIKDLMHSKRNIAMEFTISLSLTISMLPIGQRPDCAGMPYWLSLGSS